MPFQRGKLEAPEDRDQLPDALLRTYLKQEVPLMNENNIRLRYIGRIHELPPRGAGAHGMGHRADGAEHRHDHDRWR